MTNNFDDKKSNVIELPRKIRWSHHVLGEAQHSKSSQPSQYLLDWWNDHPEQDPRKKK